MHGVGRTLESTTTWTNAGITAIDSPTDIYMFWHPPAFDNSGSTLAIQGSRSSLEQYTGVFRYNDDNDNWVNLAIGLAAQYTGMLPSFNYGQADISKDGRDCDRNVRRSPTPSGFVDVYERRTTLRLLGGGWGQESRIQRQSLPTI